jgi:GNAT superfamily N-acetyltransferase
MIFAHKSPQISLILKNTITIRRAAPEDAAPLSHLICANALVTLQYSYSPVQMKTFQDYYSTERMQSKIAEQKLFCACIDGEIVGTVAITGNLVVGFYTHPEYLGHGIGSLLMQRIVQEGRAEGYGTLQLTSSPVATQFYLNKGWQVVKPVIWEHAGVGFDETLMEFDCSKM